MESVRRHVWISGQVQGVWFRESTRRQAESAGVRGFVRNLPDGRVEAILEGPADQVAKVAAWCRQGPAGARVEHVEAVDEPATGEFEGFQVLREGRS